MSLGDVMVERYQSLDILMNIRTAAMLAAAHETLQNAGIWINDMIIQP